MRLALAQSNLVMLPGLDGTGELLSALREALRDRFDASIVRFPNHKPLNYQQLFPAIREVLPWGKPYTLLADSFSGHLALLFAEEQPQDIERIILCSSFMVSPASQTTWWTKMLANDPFKIPFSEETLKTYFLGDGCTPALLGDVKRVFNSVPTEILEFRWHMAFNTNTWPQLARCRKPILYLAGNQDRFSDVATLRQIQLQNSAVEIVSMKGPHCLLQSAPREAAGYIDSFAGAKLIRMA